MTDIIALRTQEYSTNIELLSQQMKPKFAEYTRKQTGNGKAMRMLSQAAKTDSVDITTSATPAMNIDVSLDGRWVYPIKKGWGTVVDDLELLQTNIKPQGIFVQDAVASLNRAKDTLFLNAFFGTAQTGEAGGTSTTFPSANQVLTSVGATTDMNLDKILAGLELLHAADVNLDMEAVYCAVSPKQWNDLAAVANVGSRDFYSTATKETGKLPNLFGVNFVVSTLLPVDGSSYRRCPMWVASGMGQGVWKDISGRVRNRSDLFDEPDYVEASMMVGFTRLEEAKCIEIKCAE